MTKARIPKQGGNLADRCPAGCSWACRQQIVGRRCPRLRGGCV